MTKVPVGRQILVGAPKVPLDPRVAMVVREEVMKVAAIGEAHVPQVFIEGAMEKPAKLIVIVVDAERAVTESVEALMTGLAARLSADEYLEILPVVASNSLVQVVRRSKTEIFRR